MKHIKSFAGVISVAIIGSAFWEFLFRDLFLSFFKLVVSLFGRFSESYLDRFYAGLSQGDVFFLFLPSTFIVLGIMAWSSFMTLRVRARFYKMQMMFNNNGDRDENEDGVVEDNLKSNFRRLKRYRNFITVASILLVLVYAELLAVNVFKFGNKRMMERNLGIIKPYISVQTNDLFVSEYLLINSKASFDSLNMKIDSVANQNSLKLPKTDISL